MEVYVDLLLGLNMAMNYAVLWAAGRLANVRTTAVRLAAASLVGAAYSLILVVPSPAWFHSTGVKVGLSLAMIAAAYRPRSLSTWARTAGCFYLAAVTAGGTALAVSWLILPQIEGPAPLIAAALGACVLLGRSAVNAVRAHDLTAALVADIEIVVGSRVMTVPGLIDTGNRLRDPFGSTPVVVVDREVLTSLAPGIDWMGGQPVPEPGSRWLPRFRAIPYRTLDRRGIMYGLRPDRVTVIDRGRRLTCDRVLLGASPGPVSPDGRLRALIPPEIVWRSYQEPAAGRLRAVRAGGGGED